MAALCQLSNFGSKKTNGNFVRMADICSKLSECLLGVIFPLF